MLHHGPDSTQTAWRSLFRSALGFLLAFHIGGFGALVVQTGAWLQMANEAGGVHRLVWAMTEAPRCRGCEAAHALLGDDGDEPGVPAPAERFEFLRQALAAEEIRTPFPKETAPLAQVSPLAEAARLGASRFERPPVPPPRPFVA